MNGEGESATVTFPPDGETPTPEPEGAAPEVDTLPQPAELTTTEIPIATPTLSEQFARAVNVLNSSIGSLRTKQANREHTQEGIAEADRAIEIAQEGRAAALDADTEAEDAIVVAKTDGRTAVSDAQGVLQEIGETIFR